MVVRLKLSRKDDGMRKKDKWKPQEGSVYFINAQHGVRESVTLCRAHGEPLMEFLKALLAWRNIGARQTADLTTDVCASVWVKGREYRFRDVPGMIACYRAQMAG